MTAGQVSDFKGADVLLADLPEGTEEVIGDRGYDSNRIRRYLVERNITACIPPRKNRKSKPSYNWHLYKKRHLIENMFAKLKDWRRVATRYEPVRSCLQSTSQRADRAGSCHGLAPLTDQQGPYPPDA
ncbi:transposase [Komagataeibacter xylinus]|uniref:transposase n=1 Tax=Komagataeibacter xylinus TaxID=28448 RepID=UPI0038D21B06